MSKNELNEIFKIGASGVAGNSRSLKSKSLIRSLKLILSGKVPASKFCTLKVGAVGRLIAVSNSGINDASIKSGVDKSSEKIGASGISIFKPVNSGLIISLGCSISRSMTGGTGRSIFNSGAFKPSNGSKPDSLGFARFDGAGTSETVISVRLPKASDTSLA